MFFEQLLMLRGIITYINNDIRLIVISEYLPPLTRLLSPCSLKCTPGIQDYNVSEVGAALASIRYFYRPTTWFSRNQVPVQGLTCSDTPQTLGMCLAVRQNSGLNFIKYLPPQSIKLI